MLVLVVLKQLAGRICKLGFVNHLYVPQVFGITKLELTSNVLKVSAAATIFRQFLCS